MSGRERTTLLGRTRKSRAFVYAAVVHVIVLVILLTSTDMTSTSTPGVAPAVPIVKARVVDQKSIDKELKRLKAIENEKIRSAEKKRRDEEQKIAALKKERLLLDKKKKEEKQRIVAEKKKIEKEKLELAARKKKEAAELKRVAAEEKRRLAEERKKLKEERAQAEAELLRKALESEEAELVSAAEQRADDSEITSYIEALRTKVASVFIYPPGLEDGLNCTLYVLMIPGGDVVEARVTQSSGNALFDRQAENAGRKAAPLPVPSNPRLFKRMRKIKFGFDP